MYVINIKNLERCQVVSSVCHSTKIRKLRKHTIFFSTLLKLKIIQLFKQILFWLNKKSKFLTFNYKMHRKKNPQNDVLILRDVVERVTKMQLL